MYSSHSLSLKQVINARFAIMCKKCLTKIEALIERDLIKRNLVDRRSIKTIQCMYIYVCLLLKFRSYNFSGQCFLNLGILSFQDNISYLKFRNYNFRTLHVLPF